MQGNLLFVGCSHTNGYWFNDKTNDKNVWDNNNYAQIYSQKLADEQCYIYSSAGAPNSKYPRWIRHILNIHKPLGIVIQSTYWDRWLMANNMSLEFIQTKPDYFTRKFKEEEKYIQNINLLVKLNKD